MAQNILCLAGSIRQDSFNRKLSLSTASLIKELGGNSTWIDLSDYPLPIYNGDLEDSRGLPAEAARLQKLFLTHDGLMIASPEYNGFFTPLLKNTIDWLSRPNPEAPDQPGVFKHLVAGLSATSAGKLGGLRGLIPLRTLLSGIGVTVVAPQLAIPAAHEKFDDKFLVDAASRDQLATVIKAVLACQFDERIT